jgi:DNA-binding beta-propeller fold protein YncE
MTTLYGNDRHRYELADRWAKLPEGWTLGDVPAVGVDRHDNVYLFNRGPHPMIVVDREGNFLRSWGEDLFTRPHGLHIGADDMLYCTDEGDHTVRKCSPDGKVVLQIGVPGTPAGYMMGEPFHRCTHTALSPDGEIYVSDGYGNARVHKYAPDGRHILSWGEPGTDPGQFNIPHNICCDADGWVYVADRENHRIQIFDRNGRYETQWNNLHRPSALFMKYGRCPICYIGEAAPAMSVNLRAPNLGARVSVLTHEGDPIVRLGDRYAGTGPGQFLSPHGIAVDSRGDIYVGEVAFTTWPRFGGGAPLPRDLRSFRKLARLGEQPDSAVTPGGGVTEQGEAEHVDCEIR